MQAIGTRRAATTAWKCTCRHYATRRSPSDTLLKPIAADMIGAPDPVSNLRPVRYYVASDESPADKEWREMRERVDAFNQDFWTRNNTMFLEAKASYEQKLEEQGHEVTAEALSVFYKDFLDKSYERQMEYNRTWWRLNLSMLYPGCKAAIRRLLRKNEPLPTVSRVSYWDKSFES